MCPVILVMTHLLLGCLLSTKLDEGDQFLCVTVQSVFKNPKISDIALYAYMYPVFSMIPALVFPYLSIGEIMVEMCDAKVMISGLCFLWRKNESMDHRTP